MMYKKELISFVVFLLSSIQIIGQCGCTDCPVNTISNGTVTSTITISGASNNVLGSNGQELISIFIDYVTDAINEVNVTLIAPNGSSVLLIEQTGISVNQNLSFLICFNSCDGIAIPDPGFSEFFDSNGGYQPNTDYGGTYYPTNANLTTGVGCLESLSGPVNGDWTLQIEDEIFLDDGTINDWFLVFADNSGTDCTGDLGCALAEMLCEADAGEIETSTFSACLNDPSLNIGIAPDYPGSSPPDEALFGYYAVVYNANTGVIIEFTEDPDFSTFPVGEYTMCGLSYLLDDESLLPPINGVTTITDLSEDIDNSVFCGELTLICRDINVLAPPDPAIFGPLEVCPGELVQYNFNVIDPLATYGFTVNIGTFSFFEINNNVLSVVFETGPIELCGTVSNDCGTFEDCLDITVSEGEEEITLIGPESVCVNQSYTYTLLPPLQAGEFFNVVVTGGNLESLINNIAVINWDEENISTGEICVTKIGGDCPGEETCFDINILDIVIPDEIFLDEILCEGESSFATVMGNSDIIDYSWELTNLTEVSGNGTPTISYIAEEEGIATVCLTMQSLCGFSDEICEDITIISNEPPEILIASDLCDFEFTLASIISAGSNLQWSLLNGPGTATFSNPNSQTTNVTVSEAGIYEFELEENNNGCVASSTINVELFPPLSILFTDFECNSSQEYSVEINITGGNPPYSVNSQSIIGNVFVSDLFLSGEMFNFFIEDDAGCNLPVLSGTFECLCSTDAGTMSDEIIEVCAEEGSLVQAVFLLDSTMVDGDVGLYYLHDSPGSSLGNIIDFNDTGSFEFQSGIIPGVTYYISMVVGQAQNGIIDLDNSCTFVSPGQAVVFYPKPQVSWHIQDTICGNSFYLSFFDEIFLDSISWEFVSGPSEMEISTSGDTSYFVASESSIYEYNLLLFNDWCDTIIPFTFDVPSDPILTDVQQNCTLDPSFYTLSFIIEEGEAPYSANIPGTFVGNEFVSDEIDVTQSFTLSITDFNGCIVTTEILPINCSCDILIGSFNTDTIVLCAGDILDPLIISNQDFEFDESIYSVFYYTYTSENDEVDDFINFSDGASFNQSPDYNFGQVYYLRLIISIPDSISSNGLNLDDPCLTVSEAIPFIWLNNLTFDFAINDTLCTSEIIYDFDYNFQGPFPYQIGFENQDEEVVEFTINENVETLSFPILEGTNSWILNSYTGICGFDFTGNFIITGEEFSGFMISPVNTLCNNALFGSMLELDNLLSDPGLVGDWMLEGMEVTGNIIDFDNFAEGSYTVVFSSNGNTISCPVESDSIEIYINDCDCPIVNMIDQKVCGNQDNLDLSLFVITDLEGEFQVENTNGLVNPPIILNGNMLDFQNASIGEYEITYTLLDSWPDDCQTTFSASFIIEYQNSSGISADTLVLCPEDNMDIYLYDLISEYDEGGTWYFVDLPVSDSINLASVNPGIYEYFYTIQSATPCVESTTFVQIEISPSPDVEIITDDVLCFGDTNGEIQIEIYNEEYGPFECILNGNEFEEKEINGLQPGLYIIEVTSADGCSVVFDSIEIGEPNVVDVELGEDLIAFYNQELTIEAIINLLQSDISDISWEDLEGNIPEDDLTLIQQAINDNTIFLTITDENGCVGFDSIRIRLIEQDISLPNIFIPNSNINENTRFGMPYVPSVDEVLDFRIYDRWGNRVFAANNVAPGSEEGFWYGKFNGQDVQQGVFCYYMSYRLVSGVEKAIIGDVTVMR